MAVAFSEILGSYDPTDVGPWAPSASQAAVANRLYLLGLYVSGSNPVLATPTWSSLGSFSLVFADNGSGRSIAVYRGLTASPGGASAIGVSISTGSSITGCAWSLIEVTGMDTSGANGAGAIVQAVSATGTATSGNATLAAYTGTDSRPVAFFGAANNGSTTPEWANAGADSFGGSPATCFRSQWNPTTQDTTPGFTIGASQAYRTIAIEIAMAAAGGAPSTPQGWGVPVFFDKVRGLWAPRERGRLWTPRRREVLV